MNSYKEEEEENPPEEDASSSVRIQRCKQCKMIIPECNQNQGIAVCVLCSLIQHSSLSEWTDFFGTPIEAPAKKQQVVVADQAVIGRNSNPLPYNNKLDDKILQSSENSVAEPKTIKDQIAALERPPTPEEKLACCMEDLAIISSATSNPTTSQASSASMVDTEEKLVEDIFLVDKLAREKKEQKKISIEQNLFQSHAQEMNVLDGAIEKGKEIIKKVNNSSIAKSIRKRKLKSAAALFVACKMTQIKKDVKEIAFVTGTTQKDISRCQKKLKKIIPEQLMVWSPQQHVEMGCEKLQIPKDIAALCQETVTNLVELEVLTGKKPATIAGVAIWMVVNKHPELLQYIKSPMAVQKAVGLNANHPHVKDRWRDVEPIENLILPVCLKRQKLQE